jgi:ABC-type transport system involved in cytochrome c biogenesis permease subunit
MARDLARMIYGTLCFAVFFSFVGTVLGGLWADDSWGRFWGWDPKENGALLIVLWNAIILHARWGGMIRERGLAVLAVVGNLMTAWSWFGVNLLGIGLHNYGFDPTILIQLITVVSVSLPFVLLGFLPLRAWRSRAVVSGTAT